MSVPPASVDPADPTLGRPVEGAADCPQRYAPGAEFPPYRFVPGKAPHPFAHEGGWGHGVERPNPAFVHRGDWENSPSFLAGVDLFNRGWWWEAHETWEVLWHVVEGRDEVQHQLLKGLIQLAACSLNRERGSDAGATRLLHSACELLEQAQLGARSAQVMGLDLADLRSRAVHALAAPVARVEGFYLRPR